MLVAVPAARAKPKNCVAARRASDEKFASLMMHRFSLESFVLWPTASRKAQHDELDGVISATMGSVLKCVETVEMAALSDRTTSNTEDRRA